MPPFDVPVEASEMLAFTPASLANIASPPVFMLRAYTHRDKRHWRYLQRAEGVARYGEEEIREVTRKELQRLWSPEIYTQAIGRLESYWEASDQWEMARQHDPKLKFDFPQEKLDEINRLSDRLQSASPELRMMQARNADAAEMQPLLIVAVLTHDFTGLDCPVEREGGYLTINCVEGIKDALLALEKKHDIPAGMSFVDLMIATTKRMKLDGGEEKNSASPSPDEPDQKNLNTESGRSKSPASARSKKRTSAE